MSQYYPLEWMNRDMLEKLSVNETRKLEENGPEYFSLRAHVRAACAAGNIKPAIPGSQVAAMGKEACVAALLGETVAPVAPAPVAPRPPVAPSVPVNPADSGMAAMAAMLAPHLQGLVTGGVSAEAVQEAVAAAVVANHEQFRQDALAKVSSVADVATELVQKAVANLEAFKAELLKTRPVELTLKTPNGETVSAGRQHFMFPVLLACIAAKVHSYVVGPAGTGKTSVAQTAAKVLRRDFRGTSFCNQTPESRLVGFVDAQGVYRSTAFRQTFEFGGVFCGDEIDNGNPNVIAVLNSGLANDGMDFPDARIDRHADFICVATANTYGTGSDRQYVGRNQLDAATLDRFAFIEFPADEGFEAHLAGIEGKRSPACDLGEGGLLADLGEWAAAVFALRKAAEKLKNRVVISQRALHFGKRLAEQGMGRAWLCRLLLKKGMDDAGWQKLCGEAGLAEWGKF